MKTRLLSAYVCGSTGKVVAIVEEGMYLYKELLSEKKTAWLMGELGKKNEIDLTHWVLEWELSKCGS